MKKSSFTEKIAGEVFKNSVKLSVLFDINFKPLKFEIKAYLDEFWCFNSYKFTQNFNQIKKRWKKFKIVVFLVFPVQEKLGKNLRNKQKSEKKYSCENFQHQKLQHHASVLFLLTVIFFQTL